MSITTSQAYKDMMNGRVIRSRIEVTVESDLERLVLRDGDIVAGSLTANWRASNNKALTLGTCYSASLSFSSFQDMNTQIQGKNLKVMPVLYYDIGNNAEESIPLGVFYCGEPTTFQSTTAYDCLDAMTFFDKPVTSRTVGTPFNLLGFICSQCGVVLGNTSIQVNAMPNGQQTMVIDPKEVRTYRDALAYIATVLGGYCIIGRDGKLYVRQFHTVPDGTFIRKRRLSTSFGGYQTMFSGVTARFLAAENYYPYNVGDGGDGVVLDLGDIPIIEASEGVKRSILAAIWGMVQQIEYYPCSIDMVGDPSIEAGDMLETPDREGYMRNILLTSVTFTWHGQSNILSEGANPKITDVSTANKRQTQRSEAQAASNAVVTATFVNADQISVGGADESLVTSLRFGTNKELTAIFGAEIPVFSSGEGYVDIGYYHSGILGEKVRARVHEGYNLITLVNHIYYEANQLELLQLEAQTVGIGSGSAPTLTIEQNTIRSYIFAQGIETEAPWDGIIVISEAVPAVTTALQALGLTEQCAVYITSEDVGLFSEVVAGLETGMQTTQISGTMTVEFTYGDHILRCGMGNRCGAGRMFAPISTGGN